MIKQAKIFTIFTILIILLSLATINFILHGCLTCAQDSEMIKTSIIVNNDTRTFYVHLPVNYTNSDKKLPVVLIYHGTVADANKIKNYTKFNPFADKNDIIVVYPEYMGNFEWDLKPAEKSKDIIFTSKLIDYMNKNYKVDSKRIYATGYSSGAEMSYLLACTLPDKIAAFAPICGNMRKSYVHRCHSDKPAPILLVHGTADPYEKWDGDTFKNMISVDDTLKFWKDKNSCSSEQKETIYPHKDPNITSTTAKLYIDNNCKDNTEVSLLKIEGGGHTWPNSPTSLRVETFLGKTNYDIIANEIIWDFFKRHKLN